MAISYGVALSLNKRPRALEHKADFVSGLGLIKPLGQLCHAVVYLTSNSALAFGGRVSRRLESGREKKRPKVS